MPVVPAAGCNIFGQGIAFAALTHCKNRIRKPQPQGASSGSDVALATATPPRRYRIGEAMSKTTTVKARPLSPHLQVYRLIPTMLMSIVHRITGGALYFGMVLFVIWLAAASGSKEAFDTVNGIYGSWFGRLVLFGFTWAMIHHLVGGLRHLVWDTGRGLEKATATKMAKATIAVSIVLTILVWIIGYAVRGGF